MATESQYQPVGKWCLADFFFFIIVEEAFFAPPAVDETASFPLSLPGTSRGAGGIQLN